MILREISHLSLVQTIMEDRIYGVVLWADASDNRAVIWCEDHGSLAFYSEPEISRHGGVPLDAGDLIEFDMREDEDFRRAHNLCRVKPRHAPDLPGNLHREAANVGSNVIRFPGSSGRRSA